MTKTELKPENVWRFRLKHGWLIIEIAWAREVKWDLFSFEYSLIQSVSTAETVSAASNFYLFFLTCEIITLKKRDDFMVYFVSYDEKLNTFGIVN